MKDLENPTDTLTELCIELSSLRDTAILRGFNEGHIANDRINQKAQYLRAKYPDYENYVMYHILTSSGMDRDCPNFDFPENDNVADFIRNL